MRASIDRFYVSMLDEAIDLRTLFCRFVSSTGFFRRRRIVASRQDRRIDVTRW
jgi:hypothetical protein